jgi:hypothetical protein
VEPKRVFFDFLLGNSPVQLAPTTVGVGVIEYIDLATMGGTITGRDRKKLNFRVKVGRSEY